MSYYHRNVKAEMIIVQKKADIFMFGMSKKGK